MFHIISFSVTCGARGKAAALVSRDLQLIYSFMKHFLLVLFIAAKYYSRHLHAGSKQLTGKCSCVIKPKSQSDSNMQIQAELGNGLPVKGGGAYALRGGSNSRSDKRAIQKKGFLRF